MIVSEKELIEKAISLKLHSELLAMLEGKSEYADPSLREKLDRHSRRLMQLTIDHLQYAVDFNYLGEDEMSRKINGKIVCNYPQYFEAWKLAGAPGISITALLNLIDASGTH